MSQPEKVQKQLIDALVGCPLTSGSGLPAGTCTGAAATKNGVCLYIKLNKDMVKNAGGELAMDGFSFEIPLYFLLPEGVYPISPGEPGRFRVSLSNDAVVDLDFNVTKQEWLSGGKKVGEGHQVRMPNWSQPAIVIGFKLLAKYYPGMQSVVVSEEVQSDDLVGEPGKQPAAKKEETDATVESHTILAEIENPAEAAK